MLLRYKSIALTCLGSLGFLLFLGLHLPRRLHHKSAPKRLLQPVVNDIPLSSPPISQQGHLEQNFSSGRPAKEIVPPDAQFVFDASRDASNYGLNRGQCHAAFSELFSEINRAKSQWEGKVILPDDIDVSWKKDGLVRVLIHKRRVGAKEQLVVVELLPIYLSSTSSKRNTLTLAMIFIDRLRYWDRSTAPSSRPMTQSRTLSSPSVSTTLPTRRV